MKLYVHPKSYDPITGDLHLQVDFRSIDIHKEIDAWLQEAKPATVEVKASRNKRSMRYEQQKLFFWMIDQYLIHNEVFPTVNNRYAVYRVIQRQKFPVKDTLLLEGKEIPVSPESVTQLSLEEMSDVIEQMKDDWSHVRSITDS